jgi:hypothetical protein
MSTDRPEGARRKPGILPSRVPKPAPPAELLAQSAVPPASAGGPFSAMTEAQAALAPVESEFVMGDELGIPRDGKSESAAAMLASLESLLVFSIPTRTLHWKVPGNWWLGAILSGSWPLILNGVLDLTYGRFALHTGEAWLWLTIFAVTQAGALLAGRILWGRLIRDMPIIVEMLPGEAADHKLAEWIRSWCALPLQAVAGLAVSGLGAFVLWLASAAVGRHLELGPVSYISVAWTSFMGGLALYVFVMATLITLEIQFCGPLVLDPWDPSSTPGLRTLSRGYIYCVSVVIVIAAGLEVVATRVPGYQGSHALGVFVVGFPIFTVLCGIFVGLVPHLAISHMTYLGKMKTADLIDKAIGDINASMNKDHGRVATLVWLRSQVSSTPGLPMRAPWLVPLAAALIGPLVAFILTLKR